jgi:hypothetical protein
LSTSFKRAQTSKAKWERREQGWDQRIRGLQMSIISLKIRDKVERHSQTRQASGRCPTTTDQ